MPDCHSPEIREIDLCFYSEKSVYLDLRSEAGSKGVDIYCLEVGWIFVLLATHLKFKIFKIIEIRIPTFLKISGTLGKI